MIDAEWPVASVFVRGCLAVEYDCHCSFDDGVVAYKNIQYCKGQYDISQLTTVGRL